MSQPDYGVPYEIAPGLRRVTAQNPGPMTYWGTNSFLIGTEHVAVVDPGPDLGGHHAALISALSGATLTHILVTHAHGDHSPLARRLSDETGAPIYAFGPPEAGRQPHMQALAEAGLSGGGEGVDTAFRPDVRVTEGTGITGKGWHVDVLHTPGHFAGHIAFRVGDHLLSGDHVMDWASSLVSPPDGDVAAFMQTTDRLRDLEGVAFHPAHGDSLADPVARLTWLADHRRAREAGILGALTSVSQPIEDITRKAYADIDARMLPAAARNVFAHLIDLVAQGRVTATPTLSEDALFHLR